MMSGGGSLVSVTPIVFGNESPATAHISRRIEVSLSGRPLLRKIINKNFTDLHRNGSNTERFEICDNFISCNERIGTIMPVVLLFSLIYWLFLFGSIILFYFDDKWRHSIFGKIERRIRIFGKKLNEKLNFGEN